LSAEEKLKREDLGVKLSYESLVSAKLNHDEIIENKEEYVKVMDALKQAEVCLLFL
jgi:hypothetical protein